MRLITVVAGSESANNSFSDTQRLLEYGFRFFETHKLFKKDIEISVGNNSRNEYKIFCVDAALIYESGADTHMDYVVVITSHLRLRIERVMERGDLTRDEFLKRLDLQWPDEDKVHMADFVIHNNGTLDNLISEAKKIRNESNFSPKK